MFCYRESRQEAEHRVTVCLGGRELGAKAASSQIPALRPIQCYDFRWVTELCTPASSSAGGDAKNMYTQEPVWG